MPQRSRYLLTALLSLCAVVLALPAAADFSIASTSAVEKRPAVAYNPINNEFMAVYLSYETPSGFYTVRAQRFSAAGARIGGEISPFGIATHDGIGRPDIAYSPNSNTYYVVVAESVGGTQDRVLGRPLAADGTPRSPVEFLFVSTSSFHYDDYGAGHSALRVTHNSTLDEFVVTYQQKRPLPTTGEEYRVLAQRISDGATVGSEVELYRMVAWTILNKYHHKYPINAVVAAVARKVMMAATRRGRNPRIRVMRMWPFSLRQ